MASLTDYSKVRVLNHTLRSEEVTPPAFWYAGLSVADPTGAGLFTGEISDAGTGYGRIALENDPLSWTAPVDLGGKSAITNLVEVLWADPEADWGVPGWWFLADAVTGGNMWIQGPIDGTLRPITAADDPVSFAPGAQAINFGIHTSLYFEALVLNWLFRGGTFTKFPNLYWGLFTDDPGRDNANMVAYEFNAAGYGRVASAISDAAWNEPTPSGTDMLVTNAATLAFDEPEAGWGTYNFTAGYTEESAGELIFHGPSFTPRTVNANDNPPLWLPGNLGWQVG